MAVEDLNQIVTGRDLENLCDRLVNDIAIDLFTKRVLRNYKNKVRHTGILLLDD